MLSEGERGDLGGDVILGDTGEDGDTGDAQDRFDPEGIHFLIN
jgi:hypothetical protein